MIFEAQAMNAPALNIIIIEAQAMNTWASKLNNNRLEYDAQA